MRTLPPEELVKPYCYKCGKPIESLRPACPIRPGTSTYVCNPCNGHGADRRPAVTVGHIDAVTRLEQSARSQLVAG